MAYEQTDTLKRRIEQLSTPMFTGQGAGLANAIRARRAGKYEKQLTEAEKRNEANRAQELAMLLKGAETGRVGDFMGAAQLDQATFTDPTVQQLAAELRLKRASEGPEKPIAVPANSRLYDPNLQKVLLDAEQTAEGRTTPAAIQQYQFAEQLRNGGDPQAYERFMAQLRNPYANVGGELVNPYAQGMPAAIPRTLAPENLPETRGAQQAAVEAARTAAIPEQVMAEAAANRAVARPQAETQISQQQQKVGFLEDLIDKAKSDAGDWTTGFLGNTLSAVPGTPAHDLAATIDTIKANIGFDQLQAMRDASPTGGALGQVAVQEINYLQSLLGNLAQSQSKDQFIENLENVRAGIRRVVHGSEQQFDKIYGSGAQGGALTPEEQVELEQLRARFGRGR